MAAHGHATIIPSEGGAKLAVTYSELAVGMHRFINASHLRALQCRGSVVFRHKGRGHMERRWGNRLVLDEMVRVMREQEIMGLACLHEVSLSGGLLRTRWQIPSLTRVHVELCEEGPVADRIIEAFVVRRSLEGVGLEWCEFAPPCVVKLMDGRRTRIALLAQDLHQVDERRRILK
jgi:hypothetical protein